MAEQIIDGTGKGEYLKIDSENRAHTFSVTEPVDKHINRDGKTWSLSFTTTPVGAGDYFFYFKNTGSETLSLTDIRMMGAATDTIHIEIVEGTPSYTADADILAVARNLGSSKSPTATIKKDTDITGLSSKGELFFMRLDTANKLFHLSTSSNIIIPQGGSLAIKATTGTSLLTGTVSITTIHDH